MPAIIGASRWLDAMAAVVKAVSKVIAEAANSARFMCLSNGRGAAAWPYRLIPVSHTHLLARPDAWKLMIYSERRLDGHVYRVLRCNAAATAGQGSFCASDRL